MQIVFVSNYINHHQIPLSDRLYELTKGQYIFIQTEPMEQERVNMGWAGNGLNKPYLKLFYEDEEECRRLILESDAVIFGGARDESLIIPRLEAGRFTLRYSERLYKEGRWKFISPRGLKQKHFDHTRFKDGPAYLLCAGAHVKGDFKLIHAYPGKMLKFGYFPKFESYGDVHELRKDNEVTEILWAARFIDWKHPEVMTDLAERLKKAGLSFHITMIGNGELWETTRKDAESRNLTDREISFPGAKNPDEVRTAMRAADIFILTSDRNEGWGAVINEAMNSGCVTIAAKETGGAPYLISDGRNGFKYRACHTEEILKHVMWAMDNPEEARKLGSHAYETIRDTWNADVAADRLYKFIEDPEHNVKTYADGPVSEA